MSKSDEKTFQNEMIDCLVANGWLLGDPKKHIIRGCRRTQSVIYIGTMSSQILREEFLGVIKN